jgi:4-oxalocrotonate tautomerase
MPFAQISILEGRSDELKAELIREVTDAIHRSIGAPKESVRVAIYEVKKSDWGIGGETAASLGR